MFWAGSAGRWKRAQHVVDPAVEWLEHAAPPFFLWVHVMDPHHPYEPPIPGPWEDPSRDAVHADSYERLTINEQTQRLKDLRTDRRLPTKGEIAYLVGRYDAEILHADRELARLRAGLESRGFDDRNTVLVVTADHGEEFGDHGRMLHGHTLFDELIRVPLVMRGPGIPRGKRIEGQVQALDVMATLVDLAGLVDTNAPGDSTGLDGATLRPALAGDRVPARPALSFLLTRYVACRTSAWKVVAAFEPYELTPPSWIPWEGFASMARVTLGRPHRPSIGLWRLEDDPHERRDIASADPASFRTAYATLLEHRRAHPPRLVASSVLPGLDDQEQRTLRALGYVQ
jgi:arylsulfatase A-like enzyme